MVAQARLLVATCCRMLGDEATAVLELEAACEILAVRLLRHDDLGADDKGSVRHRDRDIAWFADPAGTIHSVARLKTPLPHGAA